jgi:hypothetical protein
MSSQLTNAPAKACRINGGRFEFAAAAGADATTKPRKYRALARSAEPVAHWYYGRCVHDFGGMRKLKEKIPLDYEHYEPVGYLDQFEIDAAGLYVDGAIVPTSHPEDRGRHILELNDGGVPFEASIYFADDVVVEYVAENQVAQVNGGTFEGPGLIFREWTLRGVAVCPYGQDPHTESAFKRADNETTFKITYLESNMAHTPTAGKKNATKLSAAATADPPKSDATAQTPPADEAKTEESAADSDRDAEPPADPATPPATSPAETASSDPNAAALSAVRSELKRYRTAFGDKGAVYFSDGLSFEEATAKHVGELHAQLDEANKKLSAGGGKSKGEPTPVGANVAGGTERRGFASKIRFAATAQN